MKKLTSVLILEPACALSPKAWPCSIAEAMAQATGDRQQGFNPDR